ncbi:MAG: DUF2207 family protein [Anaerolineales bacterium]
MQQKKVFSLNLLLLLLISSAIFTALTVVMTRSFFIHGDRLLQRNELTIAPVQSEATTPRSKQTQEQARLQGGIAAAISGLMAISFLLRKRLSLQQQVEEAAQALKIYTLPPQTLAPGLAAHLCGFSSAALATFFDLAQRGHLRIEEGEPKWGQRTFEIVRLPLQEPLQAHEEALLNALFRYPKKDRASLAQVARVVSSKVYQKALKDELTLRGWHSITRTDQRQHFAFLSGLLMAFGLLSFAAGIAIGWGYSLGAILMGGGSGLILAGFGGLILTLSISTLTDHAARQAVQWGEFANYLKKITQGNVQQLSPEIFERYLPFAAGFGLLDGWVSYFYGTSKGCIPDWFHSNAANDLSMQEDAFIAMILSLSAAATSYTAVSCETGASSGIVLSSVR